MRKSSKGFTIVELMIATSVLSTVIIIAFAGFLNVTKLSYKGVNISQTKTVANNLSNYIIPDIRQSSTVSAVYPDANITNGSYHWYCIGKHRYTFVIFKRVDGTDKASLASKVSANNVGMVLDTMPSSSSCPNPSSGLNSDARELLNDNMRLLKFSISSVGVSSYNINISVAFGIDEMLTSTTDQNATCKAVSGGTQFCAVSEISTTATRGY